VAGDGAANVIARARAQLVAGGARLTDLSDSNPTRHGLGDPAVLEAVARAAGRSGLYRADPRGPLPAREALAGRFGGQPGDYWLTASTSEAYSWLFALLTDPDQAVAVPAPGYPLLEPLARLALARTAGYPIHYVHSDGWIYDVEALGRVVARSQARAVVVVNPGNPTGAYVGGEVRDGIVGQCARQGAALVADEVFGPFELAAGARTSLAGEDRVLTFALDGLSKLLCAPQLKLAWIRVSGPAADAAAAAEALDRIADAYLSVNGPVAGALPDLLGLADGVVDRTRERLAWNLATARRVLGGAGFRVRRVQGGWTSLVDIRPAGLPDNELAVCLMREAGLAVHPGWFYDLPGEGALALSLLPEPPAFESNCARLVEALTRCLP
jgi:aspartate/methionine/tyrosine aminotransferase